MLLELDFSSDIPIYMQIRNSIVVGIAGGELRAGEKLPTIRGLADEAGVNMMTVNKAYSLLKQEGYIITDRRNGAYVNPNINSPQAQKEEQIKKLKLVISEMKLNGVTEEEFLNKCREIFQEKE